MRRVLRPILVFLAIVFLIEAWLWDRLEPVVARIVAIIPLARLKAELARRIDKLPPIGTLVLLVLPAGAVLPLKMLAFWLMTTGAWIEGPRLALSGVASSNCASATARACFLQCDQKTSMTGGATHRTVTAARQAHAPLETALRKLEPVNDRGA